MAAPPPTVLKSPDCAELQAAAQRVLASASFSRSQRLREFLSFVVKCVIDNNTDEINEYSLGIQVFGKSPNFRPNEDNIVRVTARHLRIKLAEYYAAEGAADPVRIEIPKGSYLPVCVPNLVFQPAAELPALYAAATVVGYVPRYEGFGLPPVEAMACGAAVVATRVGALPEITGEGIEFVAVGDVDDQARAITRLAADAALADHRRRSAIAAAGALSWGATALGHTEVYRSLLGTHH